MFLQEHRFLAYARTDKCDIRVGMRFFAALRMTGGVGVQNDRVFTLMIMRANTVSVASEWYSAKRNKPSRSCEANGHPYGMTIKSYIYKRAVGGARPYRLTIAQSV